ncbi:unnamed protein product [Bursaphelenchus xylophilus]|uniref:(pine wood nematode) hypothetical protein n=1 Tax=Bursaphelenchus xylophilus TaxID=6326 RepID=A0A1I7S5I4_BURXY|nr:unnamed protein product [Bursaphelenchus xylophilus]CAG9124742.1 unnamed protein product [Bursaphelenchus xylophilus]
MDPDETWMKSNASLQCMTKKGILFYQKGPLLVLFKGKHYLRPDWGYKGMQFNASRIHLDVFSNCTCTQLSLSFIRWCSFPQRCQEMICYFFGSLVNLLIFLFMTSNCCKYSKKLQTKKGNNHGRNKKKPSAKVEVTEHLSIHGTHNDEDLEFPNITVSTERKRKKAPIPDEKKLSTMETQQSDAETKGFEKVSITDQIFTPKKATPKAAKKVPSEKEKSSQNQKKSQSKKSVRNDKEDSLKEGPTQNTKTSEDVI